MKQETNKAAGPEAGGTSGQSVHKSKFRQKSKQEQAAASKLRMEQRGEKLEKAKDKLAKQKPPKKPGPVKRVGRTAGRGVSALCMGNCLKWNRKMWAPRGLTAPSWWASPPCGMAPGSLKRKCGSTRQRLSTRRSPNISRQRRIIISAWPPRSTRKCPAIPFPGCGASTA